MKRKQLLSLAILGLLLTAASALADEYKNVVVIPNSANTTKESKSRLNRKIAAAATGVTVTVISGAHLVKQIDDTVNGVICYTIGGSDKGATISCVKKAEQTPSVISEE